MMCTYCDQLFDTATGVLDELITARRACKDRATPGQNAIGTATLVLRALDPSELQGNQDVQEMCLALGVAVERIVALEQSGITT